MKLTTHFLFGLFLFALGLNAQETKIEKVSIFTDGNAYVEKELFIPVQDGSYILKENYIPLARYGTLSFEDDSNSIVSVKSYVDTSQSPDLFNHVEFAHYLEIFEANKRNAIKLITPNEQFDGEIIEVLKNERKYATHLLVKTEKGYKVIGIHEISSLQFEEKPNIPKTTKEILHSHYYNRKEKDLQVNMVLKFSDAKPKRIGVNYLVRGISWNPYYQLKLQDAKKGILELKAEIINDAEAIHNAELDLIVGLPNFKYDGYLTDLIDFKNQLDPKYDQGISNQSHLKPAIVTGYHVNGLMAKGMDLTSSIFDNSHDFYIHKLKGESLAKYSRAQFEIARYKINVQHFYECELNKLDQFRSYVTKQVENKIFHSLRIKNSTKTLWGRGPITIIDDHKGLNFPLAQSKLEFTPAQTSTVLKINETKEVTIDHFERLIQRMDEPLIFWNYKYHISKIAGKIILNNYKSEEIEMEIKCPLEGVIMKFDGAQLLEKKERHTSPNPLNLIQWNVLLQPGESKELTYEFEYYYQ